MQVNQPELLWGGHVAHGMQGMQIRRIQEWLCLHDIPVTIDGKFGNQTLLGLSKFFGKPGDQVKVVDIYRFAQLAAPLKQATQIPNYPAPDSYEEAVLALAKQHATQNPREIGGPNRGPWVRHYMQGKEGELWPWCAGFVTTVCRQACVWQGRPMMPYAVSCDVLSACAKKLGKFIPEGMIPQTSLAIFLVRKAEKDWTHAGFAYNFTSADFSTIEGNSNDRGSREGNALVLRKRRYFGIDFILL